MNLITGGIAGELLRSRMGVAGIGILVILVSVSVIAAVTIPLDTLQEWNNPSKWIDLPKTAMPSWVNQFVTEKVPEHIVLVGQPSKTLGPDISATVTRFDIPFDYSSYPNDFIYTFEASYTGSPLFKMDVVRPDGITLNLITTSLPPSHDPPAGGSLPVGEADSTGASLSTTKPPAYSGRIFSTDDDVKKSLFLQSEKLGFSTLEVPTEVAIFTKHGGEGILRGTYTFLVSVYSTQDAVQVSDSRMILGGKVFGLMGTDELRRDLAVGLLWGTPMALFIGITVSVGSVAFGLIYGVYAAYRGRVTEEAMMRFNDVIYALPALPFLIILAVTISNSIFVMIGFLMIFGWVGIAKISRSIALQIKTREFVQASAMMGQKNSRVIFRHIVPQLLPYAFASIAISVPAAITTEAGLSFLGLGDPTFPTWGQILHDANTFGAAARGLWWWVIPPGLMIAVTGLAFVFIGNALDAIANPRLKRR